LPLKLKEVYRFWTGSKFEGYDSAYRLRFDLNDAAIPSETDLTETLLPHPAISISMEAGKFDPYLYS